MRRLILISFLSLPLPALAGSGVLVEATNDTVMKVKYTGGTPNSTSHPAATIEGKLLGLVVNANYGTGGTAIVGSIPGATGKLGIVGTGVYGNGSFGVHGVGTMGVVAEGGMDGVSTSGYETGIYAYALSQYALAGYFDGNVYVTGNVTEGSDVGLKKNIRPITKGLNTILALQPKTYEMTEGITRATYKGDRFGLIAQDVQSLVPEIVQKTKLARKRGNDGKIDTVSARQEYLAVNYSGLIPILIKAVQEQNAKIEALEAEVRQLRAK
jgi:hypothetical protein